MSSPTIGRIEAMRHRQPGTALADTLARAGVKPCGGCKKRAKWLDRQWYKIACAWRCLTR